MENIELYSIVILFLFTLWFIGNTIKYYYGEKRKIKNLHRFAKEGDSTAQKNLAEYYQKGDIVKKDCEKSAFWYQKSVFSGNQEAKGHLQKFLEQHRLKNKC